MPFAPLCPLCYPRPKTNTPDPTNQLLSLGALGVLGGKKTPPTPPKNQHARPHKPPALCPQWQKPFVPFTPLCPLCYPRPKTNTPDPTNRPLLSLGASVSSVVKKPSPTPPQPHARPHKPPALCPQWQKPFVPFVPLCPLCYPHLYILYRYTTPKLPEYSEWTGKYWNLLERRPAPTKQQKGRLHEPSSTSFSFAYDDLTAPAPACPTRSRSGKPKTLRRNELLWQQALNHCWQIQVYAND